MPKKFEILWTGPALADLREIRDHIKADGRPMAGKKLANRIREGVLQLETFPRSGREVPEFPGAGYRELIISSYRIIYELTDNRVVVLRVWHGRRDLTRLERG